MLNNTRVFDLYAWTQVSFTLLMTSRCNGNPAKCVCAACGCSRVLYLLILNVLLSSYIVSLLLNLIRTRSFWFGDYNSAAVYWIITFILHILKGI